MISPFASMPETGFDYKQANQVGFWRLEVDRPDQQSESFYQILEAAPFGSPGELHAWCFGQFNHKSGHKGYKKPSRLLQVLRELYALEPKL
jgi:hypothetical protein